MGRPLKDNADYFTHDADMRDDPKIKALRRKFKIAGYGVWCMLLEAITDSDNFRLNIDLEIIAGDFDVETDFLQQVIQYCIQLDLLQTDEGCKTLWSKTLDNRFEVLLSKRKRDRKELSPAKTQQKGVIASESAQSKVKESKEEKRKVEESKVKQSSESTAGEPATLEDRCKDFMGKVALHLDQYSKEMLREFYDYWTETNEGGRRLRFEMQKVFDIRKRLATWSKNEKKRYNGSSKKRESAADLAKAFGERVMRAHENGEL